MGENGVSRRYFFFGSLLAGAVPVGGFGSTPSLPALGYKSVNEKLNLAAVGLGIRGPEILRLAATTENVVALCEVDNNKLDSAAARYPKASKYKDFRKMFEAERKNFDGVMIATPDHLHAPIALMAMQMGKHVYCEKPLTRTVSEVRMLAEAANKYKVATQMGNQGFNHEATKTACEIVWSGDIGDVTEVYAWTGQIYGGQPNLPETGPEKQPIPDGLDWDLYLGPAAPRDFNSLMTRQWRAFQDFGAGGSLGDWLVHNLGPTHLALQLDKAGPTSVECVKVEGKNPWIWPLRSHLVYEFPARPGMPPVKLNVFQNMRGDFQNPPGMKEGEPLLPRMGNLAEDKNRPFLASGDGTLLIGDALGPDGKQAARGGAGGRGGAPAGPISAAAGRGGAPGAPGGPGGAQQGRGGGPGGPGGMPGGGRGMMGGAPTDPTLRAPGNGAVLIGTKGYMATTSRGEGVWLLPASRWAEYKLPPQVLPRGINHQQDWVRACKGGVPGVSNFDVATKYIEWLILGMVALRVPGKLMWDSKNMRFTNNAEANKYLKPFLRKGWELKV